MNNNSTAHWLDIIKARCDLHEAMLTIEEHAINRRKKEDIKITFRRLNTPVEKDEYFPEIGDVVIYRRDPYSPRGVVISTSLHDKEVWVEWYVSDFQSPTWLDWADVYKVGETWDIHKYVDPSFLKEDELYTSLEKKGIIKGDKWKSFLWPWERYAVLKGVQKLFKELNNELSVILTVDL